MLYVHTFTIISKHGLIYCFDVYNTFFSETLRNSGFLASSSSPCSTWCGLHTSKICVNVFIKSISLCSVCVTAASVCLTAPCRPSSPLSVSCQWSFLVALQSQVVFYPLLSAIQASQGVWCHLYNCKDSWCQHYQLCIYPTAFNISIIQFLYKTSWLEKKQNLRYDQKHFSLRMVYLGTLLSQELLEQTV